MSKKENTSLGFESISGVFVQSHAFKDVRACKTEAASKAPFLETWYLCGFVTMFLVRPKSKYFSRKKYFCCPY